MKKVTNLFKSMVKIFSEKAKKTFKQLSHIRFSQSTKISAESYWQYDNITLRLFLKIAYSGNLALVSKKGKLDESCEKVWNKIIEQDSKTNGGVTAIHQINDYKALGAITKDFIMVRGALLKLSFTVDNDAVLMLAKKGYKIN